MSAISYEDLLDLLIERGCHNLSMQLDIEELVDFESVMKPDPEKSAVIAAQAIIAQSLDQLDSRLYKLSKGLSQIDRSICKVAKELVRIATALEQKKHE